MSVLNPGASYFASVMGRNVARSATALVQNTGTSLFTATGGAVILTGVVGRVTTAVANTASLTIKLQYTPSGGSAADLCGATTVTNDAVGTWYSLVSGVATDLLSVQSVSAIGGTPVAASEVPNVTFAHLLWRPIIVPAGALSVLVSNHSPGSGAVRWDCMYVPLDDGATVAAS
jgi:hypothetical protein